jgi:LacI family transcriptional regulator
MRISFMLLRMDRRRVEIVAAGLAGGFSNLMRGILHYAGPLGRWEIVKRVASRPWTQRERAEARLDGAILYAAGSNARLQVEKWGIPGVAILAGQRWKGWGMVELDDRAVGALAAEHLMSKGFQRFGYWGNDADQWEKDRESGFRAALARRGKSCRTVRELLHIKRETDWAYLYDAMQVRRWLKKLQPPVGVLACNDHVGLRLIQVAREAGLSVPGEVSIIGVDNDVEECELSPVPLTSVDPNMIGIGFAAAQLLDQMMDGRPAPDTPLLIEPREVVQRRSTDSLTVENPDVRAALEYIREHACDGITVSNVLDRVPMCRRLLERRFAIAIGRTPGQELRRIKLDRAATLLRETTLKLDAIATRCGYQHSSYLSAAFLKEFGINASKYRKQ